MVAFFVIQDDLFYFCPRDQGKKRMGQFVVAYSGKSERVSDEQKEFSGRINKGKKISDQPGYEQMDQETGQRDRNNDRKRDQSAVLHHFR